MIKISSRAGAGGFQRAQVTRYSGESGAKHQGKFGFYQVLIPPEYPKSFKKPFIPDFLQRPIYSGIGKNDTHLIPIPIHKETTGLKNAGRVARAVLRHACESVTRGISTLEIDKIVREKCIAMGAYPSTLEYPSSSGTLFPASGCYSVNNILCHGIPDSRPLLDSDIINIDITVFFKGLHADCSRTVIVDPSKVDNQGKLLVKATKQCLDKAVEICRPGQRFGAIAKVIEENARMYNFSVDPNFTGHGIGKEFHMRPYIFHRVVDHPDNNEIMREGMVFTIEPILVQGRCGYKKWPDGWTVSSIDSGRSAQFEHTILVSSNGYEILT